jgi:hypothetical protein
MRSRRDSFWTNRQSRSNRFAGHFSRTEGMVHYETTEGERNRMDGSGLDYQHFRRDLWQFGCGGYLDDESGHAYGTSHVVRGRR